MARGYVQESNLGESDIRDADRRILNNLGGGNISDDISLFSNNLRNYSTLSTASYTVDGDKIKINDNFIVPFANTTNILYNGIPYTVANSNLIDSFQLIDSGGEVFVPTAPLLDIIRKDAIVSTNIQNLNPERIKTKLARDNNLASGGWYDIYSVNTVDQDITAIEEYIEVFQYKSQTTLMADRKNIIQSNFKLNGTVVVTNLDSNGNPITGQTAITNTDPGLFVTNGSTTVRAFSDSSNPWTAETNSGVTSTESSAITVKNLIVTDLSIKKLTIFDDAGSVQSFTHSYPVEINGEIYYLLCKII